MKAKCTQCEKQFDRCQSQLLKSKNHFCSKSCAAKYNNVRHPKRQKEHSCSVCNTPVISGRKYCKGCCPKKSISENKLSVYLARYNDASRFTCIREQARRITSKWERVCVNCRYSLHVETCHIKPINSFHPSTRIKTINDPDNLILLCRNCHWEFDKGLITPTRT